MNDSRLPTILYFLMLALGLLQWAHAYPQLPETMASHFTANGTPNGWQTKQEFFLFTAAILGATALVGFVIPLAVGFLPTELINLPNKNYWLADGRRRETVGFFRTQAAWFSCALLFVVLYAIALAINANLPGGKQFAYVGMQYVLGGFLLFCLAWAVHFVRHFFKAPPWDGTSRPGPM